MRYKHDCKICKPLGEFEKYDLYFCTETSGSKTVVARFSNALEDYISGLALTDNSPPLAEAKKRAIAQGYLKGENMIATNNSPLIYDHFMYNPILTQYIRENNDRLTNKPRTKIGIIRAFKVSPEEINENCVDPYFEKRKPIVIIVHAKTHLGYDEFDIDKGENICYDRCLFVIKSLSGIVAKRKKYMSEMPSKQILKYYKEMYERARRYFKDCDEIVNYYDVFEYIPDPKEEFINDFKFKNLKLLLDNVEEVNEEV